MIAASLMLTIAGFGALAGAMRRHAKQIGLTAGAHRPLRAAGWVLLAVSLLVLIARMDWRMATITWIGQAGLAAALCVVLLTVKPRALAVLCVLAGGYGLVALVHHP